MMAQYWRGVVGHIITSRALSANSPILAVDFAKAYESVKHLLLKQIFGHILNDKWAKILSLFLKPSTKIINSNTAGSIYSLETGDMTSQYYGHEVLVTLLCQRQSMEKKNQTN
eukprot:TRINITY_DN1118_c0_g1_i2.p1 TRINITY_DN1118_c0_g1~~TRINITY_DN1118_c0_g1_i2.p1  ORF type:complete len:113 (-),score=15.42 TRINITY_DN1118_c0_g1_i2:252-590(-)